MIIYEVNLIVDPSIQDKYLDWLKSHIQTILTFPGFQSANLCFEQPSQENETNQLYLTVQYFIATFNDLNNYLQDQATNMRKEAIERFGEKFSAKRRIFKDIEHFDVKQGN